MSLHPTVEIVNDGKKYNYRHDLTLNVDNALPALVNSLRRVMLSEIPNVGFDLTPHEDISLNRIKILENTSALHNEFQAHRIALVPICTYESGRLNIKSSFNKSTCQRESVFWYAEQLPEFTLMVKNDEETRLKYRESRPFDIEKDDDILLVTTYDFKITTPDYPEPTSAFITPDIITYHSNKSSDSEMYKNYILLNKLKVGSTGKGESLHIVCRPSIGTGETHTLYSPVGTVSYKFIEDSNPEVQDTVFSYYFENLSKERENKGLKPFDEKERDEIRKSYNHLDAKRVYHRDEKGNANSIELHIESIGGMLPVQIFQHGLDVLSWKLRDIVTCCQASITDNHQLIYNLLEKITISDSPTKMDAYEIKISNEGHTVGNVVTKYLQDLYLGKLLQFVSYVKTHPLENNIIIRLQLSEKINHVKLVDWLSKNQDLVDVNLKNALVKLTAEHQLDNLNESETQKFISILIFLQGVNAVLKNLQIIKKQYVNSDIVTAIKKPVKNDNFLSFAETTDTDEYFPNVDSLVNSPGNLQSISLYQKLENEYISCLDA